MSITFCIDYLHGMSVIITCVFIMRVIQNKGYNSNIERFKYCTSHESWFAQKNCSKNGILKVLHISFIQPFDSKKHNNPAY